MHVSVCSHACTHWHPCLHAYRCALLPMGTCVPARMGAHTCPCACSRACAHVYTRHMRVVSVRHVHSSVCAHPTLGLASRGQQTSEDPPGLPTWTDLGLLDLPHQKPGTSALVPLFPGVFVTWGPGLRKPLGWTEPRRAVTLHLLQLPPSSLPLPDPLRGAVPVWGRGNANRQNPPAFCPGRGASGVTGSPGDSQSGRLGLGARFLVAAFTAWAWLEAWGVFKGSAAPRDRDAEVSQAQADGHRPLPLTGGGGSASQS